MTDMPTIRFRTNKSPARVVFGFPWVYSDEVVLDRRSKNIPAGSLVRLEDKEGKTLGLCTINPASKIVLRVLDQNVDTQINTDWFVDKFKRAAELRDRVFEKPFYRLVHAEADGLPGVIIDRFGDAFVIQPNAAWAEERIDQISDALQQVFDAKTIQKNATGRARSLEGLDKETKTILGSVDGPIAVPMNNATYYADLDGGQKTGLFFDQRSNQAFAAILSKGATVLDVFSHVGGFSLAALAAGAHSALAVDASASALELASMGAKATNVSESFETRKGDAFAVMTQLQEEKAGFDVVVCDPPSFAPSKPALDAGLRAYEKAAKMAAKLVNKGGYLVLCSCSHAADMQKFRKASLLGVGKSGRSGQIIHTGQASADHPVHPHLAETSYLKSIFLRLD